MTGPVATLRRGMSFILDPVPHCDRKPVTVFENPRPVHLRPGTTVAQAAAAMRLLGETILRGKLWLHPKELDWDGVDPQVLNARHPRSSAARLRPYNWEHELAWPVEGWVLR